MAYSVTTGTALHLRGEVPISSNSVEDDRPNLPRAFEVVTLGQGADRWDLFFTGPLDDQAVNLERLEMAAAEALNRVQVLMYAETVPSDTPLALEDDKAGEDQ
jgi:hypothetical protein